MSIVNVLIPISILLVFNSCLNEAYTFECNDIITEPIYILPNKETNRVSIKVTYANQNCELIILIEDKIFEKIKLINKDTVISTDWYSDKFGLKINSCNPDKNCKIKVVFYN